MTSGVAQLAGPDGTIVGVAVDHRDSFHAALLGRGMAEEISDALVAAIKVDVCEELAGGATMLLVDHDVAWSALVDAGGPPGDLPVAMPLEAQGYGAAHEVERTVLLEHPTPHDAASAGAAACKLLLPFRPDLVDRARAQVGVASDSVAACHAAGIPLILEPIVWTAPGEDLPTARFAELVVEAAHQLAPLQPGLLKLQHPGSRGACDDVHAACGGHPWVLLGGGAELALLERHVADACSAGAVGFIVGRSLFDGALDTDRDRRVTHLRNVARPALDRLADIARDRQGARRAFAQSYADSE